MLITVSPETTLPPVQRQPQHRRRHPDPV